MCPRTYLNGQIENCLCHRVDFITRERKTSFLENWFNCWNKSVAEHYFLVMAEVSALTLAM